MTTKLATIKAHSTVSDEQIGRCHKVFSGSQAFYMVLSESDNLTEYKVQYTREHGFTCSCPAGLYGFVNCKHGFCKHIAWAVAAAAEEKSALLEQEALQQAARTIAQPVVATNLDAETVKRVQASKGQKVSKRSTLPTSKPFSILRIA